MAKRAHGWGTSQRSQRLPANWAKLRTLVLKRDHGICHVCGEPGADQVDHLVVGDDHRPANLAAIHGNPCHRRKSAAEGAAAAASVARHGYRRPTEPHPGMR